MARNVFRQEMDVLGETVENIIEKVLYGIEHSVTSFINSDMALADKVIKNDVEIDKLKLKVEDKCIHLLALQQPLGPDLRFITTCLKMITDLDRMADRSRHIAEIAQIVKTKPSKTIAIPLKEMTDKTLIMSHRISQCFKARDKNNLETLGEQDDEIDKLQEKIFKLIVEKMKQYPDELDSTVYMLLVPRHLERIADHTTNIASRIIYMTEGDRIKIN